jgi:hypothetical protein
MGAYEDLMGGPQQAAQAPPPAQPAASAYDDLFGKQEMRAAPPGTRFGGPDVKDTLNTGARMSDLARASLAPEQGDQIKRLSDRMGIPPERFGIVAGDIVYSDPSDNQIKRVTPSVFGGDTSQGIIPYIGETMQRGARWVASQMGPALPQVAGGVTGAVTKSPGVAGGTAALVDVARQGTDRLLAGESLSQVDPLNAVGHAAEATTGQAAGNLIARLFTRNPLAVQMYDKIKAADPGLQAETAQIMALANSQGIDLTAGQATNLRSLLARERQLGRFPETADQFSEFLERQRRTQVPNAFRDQLTAIAPNKGGEAAIESFREGGGAVVQNALNQRNAKSKIAYKTALDDRTDRFWNEDIDKLMSRPSVEKGVSYARLIAKEEGRDITVPVFDKGKMVGRDVVPDWRSWDYIKRGIDRVIEENTDELGRVNAYGRSVVQTKKELLRHLDAANPDYATARAVHGIGSDAIEGVLEGGPGLLQRMKGPERQSMVENIFGGRSLMPEEIARTRDAFAKAGKLDDWNQGLRQFLSGRLDNALKMENPAQGLYKNLWQDEAQRRALEAAFGDKILFGGFENLMKVLDRVRKSLPEGSPTATDLNAMSAKEGMGLVRKATSVNTYVNPGEAVGEALDAFRNRPEARIKLADALLSGKAADQLRMMRLLNPGSEQALRLTGQILTAVMGQSGDAAVDRFMGPGDRAPATTTPRPQ